METVPRLYGVVRPQAKYRAHPSNCSSRAKEQGLTVKTGIMVGIGETDEEVVELMRDVIAGTRAISSKSIKCLKSSLRESRPAADSQVESEVSLACDILTIGQYLQPSRDHLPVTRFVPPEQFARFKEIGEQIGFAHVESAGRFAPATTPPTRCCT